MIVPSRQEPLRSSHPVFPFTAGARTRLWSTPAVRFRAKRCSGGAAGAAGGHWPGAMWRHSAAPTCTDSIDRHIPPAAVARGKLCQARQSPAQALWRNSRASFSGLASGGIAPLYDAIVCSRCRRALVTFLAECVCTSSARLKRCAHVRIRCARLCAHKGGRKARDARGCVRQLQVI
jgi:hypothetical protein